MSDELPAGSESSGDDIRGAAAQAFAGQLGDTPLAATPADTPSDPPQAPDGATSAGEPEVDATALHLRGPIPYDRHQAVLTNARNKVREQVEGEWRPKYDRLSWAETVDQQRAKDGISFLTALEAMQDDPHAALSFIARRLGLTTEALAQNGKPSEPADPMPEPDIPLDDGTAVYSASRLQQLLQWHGRQLTQQVDQSYGLSGLKHRAMLADLRMQAQQQTHDVLTECRTNEADWPLFRSLENDIKALMIQHPDLSLEGAYRRAFNGPNGWRKQQAATQKAAEEDRASQLTRKAAASDTLRSGAPRPVTPRGPDDLTTREIAAQVFSSMH